MTSYRLYMIRSGHIRAAHDLEAASDDEARNQAEDLREGQPAELWQRDRLVTVFAASLERSA